MARFALLGGLGLAPVAGVAAWVAFAEPDGGPGEEVTLTRGGVLRQRDEADGGQDGLAARAPRQALAVPALVDLAQVAPHRLAQPQALAEALGDLAVGGQHRPGHRGRLAERGLDRLLLKVGFEVDVEGTEGLYVEIAEAGPVAHVAPDEAAPELDLVAERRGQDVGVGVATDLAAAPGDRRRAAASRPARRDRRCASPGRSSAARSRGSGQWPGPRRRPGPS